MSMKTWKNRPQMVERAMHLKQMGMSNVKIAEVLGVSLNTAYFYTNPEAWENAKTKMNKYNREYREKKPRKPRFESLYRVTTLLGKTVRWTDSKSQARVMLERVDKKIKLLEYQKEDLIRIINGEDLQ